MKKYIKPMISTGSDEKNWAPILGPLSSVALAGAKALGAGVTLALGVGAAKSMISGQKGFNRGRFNSLKIAEI